MKSQTTSAKASRVTRATVHAATRKDSARARPARFFACGEGWSFFFLGARLTGWLLLLAATVGTHASVSEVGPIRITVGDLDKVLPFYTRVLPFQQTASY